MCERIRFYPAQVQTRAERPDHVVGEIGLLRIPHEANGDDLRTVQEHPADLNALTAVALQNSKREETPSKWQLQLICYIQISLFLKPEKNHPESVG